MRMRLWVSVLMGLGALLSGCAGSAATPTVLPTAAPVVSSPSDVQRITPADAKALLDEGTAVMYDTRTPDEYRSGHAAGAVLFPAGEGAARFGELPPDKALIFYCT